MLISQRIDQNALPSIKSIRSLDIHAVFFIFFFHRSKIKRQLKHEQLFLKNANNIKGDKKHHKYYPIRFCNANIIDLLR